MNSALTAQQINLPDIFANWFTAKGWQPYNHQMHLVANWQSGKSALLIAPTGAGKTLSGFLPSLIDLSTNSYDGLHTLYISPLKALATDIARNLTPLVEDMALPITIETRTGDTPQSKRNRQRSKPPHILLTTPESLELMLGWPESASLFGKLNTIIIDEIHALAGTKRGDLLSLSLAKLRHLHKAGNHAPLKAIGLSATVAKPERFAAMLSPAHDEVTLVRPSITKQMQVSMLSTKAEIPWAGHSAHYALPELYDLLKSHAKTLIFVNTRAQAELLFQALWLMNDDNFKIGLHHGSLDVGQRRKVEAFMADGKLDAVVATSSLDLGIDWADIDLVVQIGAPKGVSRLVQRIGRAGHHLDKASKAIMVPANRFEVLEVMAAMECVSSMTLDDNEDHPGALDVLAQHIIGCAVTAPFDADSLYQNIITAPPYANLSRHEFDDVLDFVATGGYALSHYEQFHRLVKGIDGLWRLTSPQIAQRWRMNIGTIVETVTMKVRLSGGPVLGEIEEYFVQSLISGDHFIFAGRMLEFIGIKTNMVQAKISHATEPKVPAYAGGRLPLSQNLADKVRDMLQNPHHRNKLPADVANWLNLQAYRSAIPGPDRLLVESFKRGQKHYLVAYCFEGRNAHQTLGMLITRRMERFKLAPLGFVATDYAVAVWSLSPVISPEDLFCPDLLGDDLEEWMAESTMLKRSFRQVATISGLIEKRLPGHEKTGKQMTVNSDLIYDVLRRHQPDHLLLRATEQDAAKGLTDIRRLSDLLARFDGKINFKQLDYISPLAVPLMLEVGREAVTASGVTDMLAELEEELLLEMQGEAPS
ncbi:MAG: ligase-associated DNA damage response DEXH box helicase [Candidatus Puniceispirillaceae bacterium]